MRRPFELAKAESNSRPLTVPGYIHLRTFVVKTHKKQFLCVLKALDALSMQFACRRQYKNCPNLSNGGIQKDRATAKQSLLC